MCIDNRVKCAAAQVLPGSYELISRLGWQPNEEGSRFVASFPAHHKALVSAIKLRRGVCASGGQDNRLCVWRRGVPPMSMPLAGWCTGLGWHPSDDVVYTASKRGHISAFDASAGALRLVAEYVSPATAGGADGTASAPCVAPDGRSFFSVVDGQIVLVDTRTFRPSMTFAPPRSAAVSWDALQTTCVAASPGGNRFFAGASAHAFEDTSRARAPPPTVDTSAPGAIWSADLRAGRDDASTVVSVSGGVTVLGCPSAASVLSGGNDGRLVVWTSELHKASEMDSGCAAVRAIALDSSTLLVGGTPKRDGSGRASTAPGLTEFHFA